MKKKLIGIVTGDRMMTPEEVSKIVSGIKDTCDAQDEDEYDEPIAVTVNPNRVKRIIIEYKE